MIVLSYVSQMKWEEGNPANYLFVNADAGQLF